MEYVIVDMRWTTLLNNKQLDYTVNQIGAIRIDENVHTIECFHRLNALDYKNEFNEQIESFCKEKHYVLHRKGSQIMIETFRATWTFDWNNRGSDLVYIPKRYVQIPRKGMRLECGDKGELMRDGKAVLEEIFERIEKTEERLQYGVGSVELERLIVEVGKGIGNINPSNM